MEENNMSLEASITNQIEELMKSNVVQEKVKEGFAKVIENTIESVLGKYSPVQKTMEKKIEEAIMPIIESHDYNKYVDKLDIVLTELLKEVSQDHKKILENFVYLTKEETREVIKLSEIYDVWEKYVAENVTENLEVNDEGESYYPVTCNVEYKEDDDYWTRIKFSCEEEPDLNVDFYIIRSSERVSIFNTKSIEINNLRYIDDFTLLLYKLTHSETKVKIDMDCYEEFEVEVESKPEYYLE